ncbi:MAG: hypothetical protein EOP35_13710 [Rubrivivax sp.]|nr:MAG: hypothetical protein EOP35_13710 [Rubrivivax sp.]
MRKLLLFLTGVLGVLLLCVGLSPWLAYELGLSRFETMPAPPAQLATAEQQAWVWELARGTGEAKVEPMNPYGYATGLFAAEGRATPSESLAYWVSRDCVWKLPKSSMTWWHLTNASLTIWLSRHWTTEQIASAAYAIAIKWPPRKPRVVNPAP